MKGTMKKLTPALLLVFLTTASAPAVAEDAFRRGDANGDGKLDISVGPHDDPGWRPRTRVGPRRPGRDQRMRYTKYAGPRRPATSKVP